MKSKVTTSRRVYESKVLQLLISNYQLTFDMVTKAICLPNTMTLAPDFVVKPTHGFDCINTLNFFTIEICDGYQLGLTDDTRH